MAKLLPEWLAGRVCDAASGDVAAAVGRVLAGSDDAQLTATLTAVARDSSTLDLLEADPLARVLGRAFIGALLPDRQIVGGTRLGALLGQPPVLMVCNHLSYVDTQVTDLLFVDAGHDELADRLCTVAGPKVYETAFRRLAAAALGTLPTAQSATLSHNDAGMSPREIARVALHGIRAASDLMTADRPVLLYPEGSRSRDGRMGPFLRAAARYARLPGLRIQPLALAGTDRVFPLGADVLNRQPVSVSVCEPFDATGDGRADLATAWRRIADALPVRHRPEADTPPLV